MKKITIYLLSLLIAISLIGCGKSPHEGKIYFMSNDFGGKTNDEMLGTSVYKNGRAEKLFRHYWAPSISRDGRMLAAGLIGPKKTTLVIMDLKTKKIRNIALKHHLKAICWFNNEHKRLVYSGYDLIDNDKQRLFNIFELNLDTGEEKALTHYAGQELIIYSFSISPDDKHIVYSIARAPGLAKGTYVKIINLSNNAEELLPFSAVDVTWSPLGDVIVMDGIYDDGVKRETGTYWVIYDTKSKGFKKLNRVGDYIMESDHAFSPDGKKVAYVRYDNNGQKALCTMNIDGTDRKELLIGATAISHLSWTK